MSNPGSKGVIVVDASTGDVVANALATRVENLSGDVIFQPNPGSGTYHIYYLPWQSTGGYYPTITYPTPDQLRAAARGSRGMATTGGESVSRAQETAEAEISWVGLVPNPNPDWERVVRARLPDEFVRATTTHIQSVDEFHSFFPMEVIASPEEEAAILAAAFGTQRPGGEAPGRRGSRPGPRRRVSPWRQRPRPMRIQGPGRVSAGASGQNAGPERHPGRGPELGPGPEHGTTPSACGISCLGTGWTGRPVRQCQPCDASQDRSRLRRARRSRKPTIHPSRPSGVRSFGMRPSPFR